MSGHEPFSKIKEAGRGAYGAVYKSKLNGAKCVVKKLHDILTGSGSYECVSENEWRELVAKFKREIELLSQQRHPNIVQFLGVCGLEGDPRNICLVMEQLDTDLKGFIEANKGNISFPLKLRILRDISCGVGHLHASGIVHRDLNAGNVLLTTSLQAKVADLGVSRVIGSRPQYLSGLTVVPGALDYMPPEVFQKHPVYGSKMDSFSFGHLALYLIIEIYPYVNELRTADIDLRTGQDGQLLLGLQVQKRKESITELNKEEENRPMESLIIACLDDSEGKRPSMRELREQLEAMMSQYKSMPSMTELKRTNEEKDHKILKLSEDLDVAENQIKVLQTEFIKKTEEEEHQRTALLCLQKEKEEFLLSTGKATLEEMRLSFEEMRRANNQQSDDICYSGSIPGLCGLSNRGNTSFMNSTLQCLSNTKSLTEYFMGEEGMGEKPYRKHINEESPQGTKGALAEAYGDLLDKIWSGDYFFFAPDQFKTMIDEHAPQFSDDRHRNSYELLAFILDGLHEDLNLVRKKPYVDMDIKTEGRQDTKEIATEAWHKYLLCNQSVIVRLFQGQFKSILNCPKCHKYCLAVPKDGSILRLKRAMQEFINIQSKNLVVIDVYHSRFHRVFYDKDAISQIMDRDDIYLYELSKPLGDTDSWIPIPVYMRELRVQKSYSYYSSKTTETTYGQVFGLPIVVTIPREGCTYRQLYNTILAQCQRYVTEPTIKPKKAKIDDVTEEKATSENDGSSKETNDSQNGDQTKEVSKDSNDKDLFKLIVVNAYGSQEVQKLHDTDKKLKLTSQTYVSCDWMIETKEKYYDVKKAEEFMDDSSCDEKMKEKQLIDIYDCLDLFGKEKENCPYCKQGADKNFSIWKLPEVLVIQLKRFFPPGLDLSKYVVNYEQDHKPIYDLFAVSNHSSKSGSGKLEHYTAYCKNKVTGKWYSFDDSHVLEINKSSVCSSSSYVLFYAHQTEGRGADSLLDKEDMQ